MAVAALPLSSALVVRYQVGETPAGAPIIRQKTFNSVKVDATTENIYEVAATLFGLVDYPIIQVILRKNEELSNE